VGFSVSGSFAILVVASFIAFGMLHSAGTNGFERVTAATHSSYERGIDSQNTAINITGVNYQSSNLDVNVTNTGSTALSINATDVIVAGVYHDRTEADFKWIEVVGDPNTELWLPGDTLYVRIYLTGLQSGDHVKIVTEHGIADEAVVP